MMLTGGTRCLEELESEQKAGGVPERVVGLGSYGQLVPEGEAVAHAVSG